MSNAAHWNQDILGPDWAARTIPLGSDTEGPVTATLVRAAAGPRRTRAVLYVHGFVDYFFQTHQAEFFEELGFDFYALDLRKYGRSLRDDQTPNFVEDLADYRAELDHAARIIASEGHEELVVLGHSTGGLIASLWVDARQNLNDSHSSREALGLEITALILNSPWFDLNKPWFLRTIGTRLIAQLARIAPRTVIGSLAPHYGRALHASSGGEWDYDLALKPFDGFPVRAVWFRAIRRGHARIAAGLNIHCPVLVLTSDRSGDAENHHSELLTTDSVLNVEHIWAGAANLADDTTVIPIPRGAHDLSLSPEPARGDYFEAIKGWLAARRA